MMTNIQCRATAHRTAAGLLCRWVASLAVVALAMTGRVCAAAELRVVAPNAVKEVASAAAARYERATSQRVVFTWSGSEAIAKRVRDGEVFDVVLNTPQNLDALVDAGRIAAGSRANFARSGVGVAVRAGASRPDVSSEQALRQAVLSARAVGISSGPSGRYIVELFQRLGVADEVKGKIRQPPSGAQIAELLARGEVDLGFQQVPELRHASGVDYLGPLPAALQNYTNWSAGLHRAAADPDAARRFLAILVSLELAPAIHDAGLETVPAK